MKKLLVLAFFGLSLFACSKKDNVDSNENPRITTIPGFGDTPGDIPGPAFSLPQGIQLQGSITGESMFDVCKDLGFGRLVDVYLVLKNTTASDINVTFPAGLTLKSASTEDQNGIVVQSYDVTLRGGVACIVKLGAHCINSSRHPSGSTSRYTWGNVCDAPAITYLLKLLKDKDLSKDENDAVQPSVWLISDAETDPQSSKLIWDMVKKDIAAIPNK